MLSYSETYESPRIQHTHRRGVRILQTFGVARLVEKTITREDTQVVKGSPVKIDVDLASLRRYILSHRSKFGEKKKL